MNSVIDNTSPQLLPPSEEITGKGASNITISVPDDSASNPVPSSKPLSAYGNLLLHHSEIIGTIETSLRTLLFFLPGRLRDSEYKLEMGNPLD